MLVCFITQDEASRAPEVITGTLYLYETMIYTLIDPGSTHSFISPVIASHMHKESEPLEHSLGVHTPLGEVISVHTVYRDCVVRVNSVDLPADLIPLFIHEFDIILGMDWLSRHRAKVDCYAKEVVIESPGRDRVIFYGNRQIVPTCLISATSAFRLIRGGCEAYLAHVIESAIVPDEVKDIPVVKDFTDVFPEDLPGLPPDRETEFTIELLPGTASISIPHYRMSLLELQELKKQLQELLDKGFI